MWVMVSVCVSVAKRRSSGVLADNALENPELVAFDDSVWHLRSKNDLVDPKNTILAPENPGVHLRRII